MPLNRSRMGEADIATVFLKRFDDFLNTGGTHCSVTPLNWYYLKSYKELRNDLLKKSSIQNLTKVGSGATAKASWDVLRAVAIITKSTSRPDSIVSSVEATSSDEEGRAYEIKNEDVLISTNSELQKVPDLKFAFDFGVDTLLLENCASAYQGLATADYPQYGRSFWEVQFFGTSWVTQHGTFKFTQEFVGLENILLWENGKGKLASNTKARIQGFGAHNKNGIVVTQTRRLPASIYLGGFFDNNVSILATDDKSITAAIWCYCSTNEYHQSVRKLDEKLGVTNATLAKVPFNLDHWTQVATEKYPNGLPKPYTNDPTQWIFHGHPCGSVVWDDGQKWTTYAPLRTDSTVLQVAVGRLLGYRWPSELDTSTELADEQREWVKRCEALAVYSDDDGIVCIPGIRGEQTASTRLRELLAKAYGDEWSSEQQAKLLTNVGCSGWNLDRWLREKFFEQHCRIFQNKPFIWHIWDGQKDGFHALVNYHKLAGEKREGRRTLESLTYSYLGDWIERQKADQKEGKEGADAKLAAALDLQGQLEKILTGEPPYDIFVRWKPLHEQAIGWDPDINDGVRLNIRPFLFAELRKGGKKGSGILRAKPNIKWGKDRGKDPQGLRPKEEFPWFWSFPGDGLSEERTNFAGGKEFDGNRWNDVHYTNAVKKAARASKEAGK